MWFGLAWLAEEFKSHSNNFNKMTRSGKKSLKLIKKTIPAHFSLNIPPGRKTTTSVNHSNYVKSIEDVQTIFTFREISKHIYTHTLLKETNILHVKYLLFGYRAFGTLLRFEKLGQESNNRRSYSECTGHVV